MAGRKAAEPANHSVSLYGTAMEYPQEPYEYQRLSPAFSHGPAKSGHQIATRPQDRRKADAHGKKCSEQAVDQRKPSGAALPTGPVGAFRELTEETSDKHSWQHCLVVYLIALAVISLAVMCYVVLSAPRQQAEGRVVHRRPTTVKILRRLTASNVSGQLDPETDERNHVTAVSTAAPTVKYEEYDREEDDVVEEKNL